jgi:putative tricarboxylic transport membrane protein
MESQPPRLQQALIGIGTLALAGVLAVGAMSFSSEAGYSGVGPNFLPWVVTVALALCGGWLIWEARTGGYRNAEEPSGAASGDWVGFAWVTVGLLANAALITTIGFILSCALCFVFAVRGLKACEGRLDLSVKAWIVDTLIGVAIAGPVYWMFTKFLSINLPGLTSTGWL